jgi:hypothetical protein
MNNQTVGAVGINSAIENIKNDIYDSLNDRWNYSFDAYGRMYRLEKEGSWCPNWYVGDNEYREILMDDTKCIMYFQVGDKDSSEDGLVFRSPCKIVFMVNMEMAYPNSTIRSDGEIQRDVIEILRNNSHERFQITGIERSLTRIFGGMAKSTFENFNDQPYFAFAVEIDLDYYLTDKC